MRRICIICLLLLICSPVWGASALETLESIPSSSLLVVDSQNKITYSKNANQLFIPASTVKLLTALISLDHWGRDHRFETIFYYDPEIKYLWVKGFGDPFLISEELDIIVEKIKKSGISELNGIGVVTNYYGKGIKIDGQGDTLNPYDASLGALSANFNTINVRVFSDSISSSEVQTPLTPLAKSLSRGLQPGTHRINIGEADLVPRYFSELLKSKLNRVGILADANYMSGILPSKARLLFTHQNSKTLEDVISSMLEYSNNFIANQLFLNLGAEYFGPPAALEKSKVIFKNYIEEHFDWNNYILLDGAGLSKKNRLSAYHLIDILKRFEPYRNLMPKQNSMILAKSGTLKNVSTYAGYLSNKNELSLFALMINQKIYYSFREKVALELLN